MTAANFQFRLRPEVSKWVSVSFGYGQNWMLTYDGVTYDYSRNPKNHFPLEIEQTNISAANY